jgi:hypothetical protein
LIWRCAPPVHFAPFQQASRVSCKSRDMREEERQNSEGEKGRGRNGTWRKRAFSASSFAFSRAPSSRCTAKDPLDTRTHVRTHAYATTHARTHERPRPARVDESGPQQACASAIALQRTRIGVLRIPICLGIIVEVGIHDSRGLLSVTLL